MAAEEEAKHQPPEPESAPEADGEEGLDLPEGAADDGDAAAASADSAEDRKKAYGGTWVFKHEGQVLGPVEPKVILKKIEEGELDGDTQVGREVGQWKKMRDVPVFADRITALEEKKAKVAEEKRLRAEQTKRRMVQAAMFVGVAAIFLGGGFALGQGGMKARPWDKPDPWLDRPPPLVDLKLSEAESKRLAMLYKAPEPKKEGPADQGEGDGEGGADAEASPDDAKSGDDKKAKASSKKGKKGKKSAKTKSGKKGKTKKKEEKKKAPEPEPTSSAPLAGLTKKQIMGPISKQAMPKWGRCIKTAVKSDPDIPGTITVEFVIGNNGKALDFKIQQRHVRKGSLANCMRKATSSVRWPAYTGERKNVALPLKWKK
jgi:hypothetical protein